MKIDRHDQLWVPENVTDDGGVVKVITTQEAEKIHPAVGDTVYVHFSISLEVRLL